jgi:hypothetical protein
MSEDITQDPEYIKGFERGIRAHNLRFTPESIGFDDGWNDAHNASQKIVESKASPVQSEQTHTEEHVTRAEFEQFKSEMNERLTKLEKYTQE